MNPSYNTIVSGQDLAAQLGNPNWRIFDCRHDLGNPAYGKAAYERAHIPGAHFMHLDRDLSGECTGLNGRHPLPGVEIFAERLRACGVNADGQVVAYDNEGGSFAARLWWLLRWLGYERVAVLDGGFAAWKQGKLPLDAATPPQQGQGGDFIPQPHTQSTMKTVTADELLAQLEQPQQLLLDARIEGRFSGAQETVDPVGGHIPGAVNRFYMDNLDDNAIFFKTPEALRAEYDELLAGREPDAVVHQCGSGVTACHNLLAMELAGLHGSRLYAGSWSEWCADPSRPIVQAVR